MTFSMLLAVAVVAPTQDAATDYFPLRPGTKYTYEEKSLMNMVTTDVVGVPVKIGGESVTPVTTYQSGREVNTTYYRVTPDAIDIVAYSLDKSLPDPLPVLRVAGKEVARWKHVGPATTQEHPEPMSMEGESRLKGSGEFLGRKVSLLEVKIKASVGGGKAQEHVTQTALYAKGIGLVELTSVTKIGRREAKNVLRLTKFEEPKEGG